LKKRTSINSIPKIHKEKEMADFRKWIYALAVMALLAGLVVPANAQGLGAAPTCTAVASGNTIVRAEGFTEQVGDITISCNGGLPTAQGHTVPQVNIQVQLQTTITSRLLGNVVNSFNSSNPAFNEALLLIDEPNSPNGILLATTPGNPQGNDTAGQPHPILNCGNTGAADSSNGGPGVCAITSTGNPIETYDGSVGTASGGYSTPSTQYTTCPTTAPVGYACGRPNVFQGTQAPFFAQTDAVVFNGVPIDAPGTTTTRTLRFTNIRADATRFAAAAAFGFVPIVATISFSNQNALGLTSIQVTVASVQPGLSVKVKAETDYLQCIAECVAPNKSGSSTCPPAPQSGVELQSVTFVEGFDAAWKPANWSYFAGTDGQGGAAGSKQSNGTFVGGTNYQYGGNPNYFHPTYLDQDVPGALYYTEGGFYYPGCGSTVVQPTPNNPPPGQSPQTVLPPHNTALCSAGLYQGATGGSGAGQYTGIDLAGLSNHGTRLAIQFQNLPVGSTVSVPVVVNLYSQVNKTINTGVMVLTSTDANGAGSYTPPTTFSNTTWVNVSAAAPVVWEILFDDPTTVETATVAVGVTYTPNLGSNLPQTAERAIATAAGGFAPFYTGSPANQPSATLDIPRFIFTGAQQTLYSINYCACNLLFPWVASTGGFDTGIALANTSLDPGATAGYTAVPQGGSVTFWYYGSGTNGVAPPGPETSLKVPAGSVMTYVLSTGAGNIYSTSTGITPNGMNNSAAGFAGYIIAQAQFQYCHAFAYISALGAGATSSGISEGYVALVLDKDPTQVSHGNLQRTVQTLTDELDH